MKKYNLSRIMKRAWEIKKQDTKNIFSICLKISWEEEKRRENGMSVEELIKKYKISQACHVVNGETIWDNDCQVSRKQMNQIIKDHALEEIRAKKDEIFKYFEDERAEKERKYQERKRKIESIEGLAEIKEAYTDLECWHSEFERSFSGDCGGFGVRPKPQYDFEAMRKQYPVADAYLRAEAEAFKMNYQLADIGHRALEKIIDSPEEYVEIMAAMEAEIKDFTESHMWD